MGLIEERGPIVASAPRGIIDPRTGRPIGSDDPFPLGDPRNCFTIDNGGV